MTQTNSILVLYTGGTFGMAPGPDGALRPLGLSELTPDILALCPDTPVVLQAMEPPLDSSSVGPAEWVVLAELIAQGVTEHKGIVVIHGTDTLAYTASALSLMFENLSVPVVVTGSMAPLRAPGSDAPQNFRDAVLAAQTPGLNLVSVAFGRRILRGCRTVKMHAQALDGFESPNACALADLAAGQQLPKNLVPAAGLFRWTSALDTNVLVLRLWPGISSGSLRHTLSQPGLGGVIVQSFGSGNAPESEDIRQALVQGLDGKLALNLTQCWQGRVESEAYAAGQVLQQAGVIDGGDMTLEAAVPKMMLALGREDVRDQRAYLQTDQRGELTRSEDQ